MDFERPPEGLRSRRIRSTRRAGAQATIMPVEHSTAVQAVTSVTFAVLAITATRQIAARIVREPSVNRAITPTILRSGRWMF